MNRIKQLLSPLFFSFFAAFIFDHTSGQLSAGLSDDVIIVLEDFVHNTVQNVFIDKHRRTGHVIASHFEQRIYNRIERAVYTELNNKLITEGYNRGLHISLIDTLTSLYLSTLNNRGEINHYILSQELKSHLYSILNYYNINLSSKLSLMIDTFLYNNFHPNTKKATRKIFDEENTKEKLLCAFIISLLLTSYSNEAQKTIFKSLLNKKYNDIPSLLKDEFSLIESLANILTQIAIYALYLPAYTFINEKFPNKLQPERDKMGENFGYFLSNALQILLEVLLFDIARPRIKEAIKKALDAPFKRKTPLRLEESIDNDEERALA